MNERIDGHMETWTSCRIEKEKGRGGRTIRRIKERGNFGDKRDQRQGAVIDGNTDAQYLTIYDKTFDFDALIARSV